MDNKSEQKDREHDADLYNSRCQLHQKFSERELKKLTIHESDQHLSFYKITRPVLENTPKIKGKNQGAAPYNEYAAMCSPLNSSDLLYSGRSSLDKVEKTHE